MTKLSRCSWLIVGIVLHVAGCQKADSPKVDGPNADDKKPSAGSSDKKGDKIEASRAQLSPEDRQLVEAQDFCPVEEENRLGAMGKPCKVILKGQPVFLCCKSCVEEAQADPDKTLAKVEKLKAKVKATPPKK